MAFAVGRQAYVVACSLDIDAAVGDLRGIVFDLAAGQGPGLRLMSSTQGPAGPDLAA